MLQTQDLGKNFTLSKYDLFHFHMTTMTRYGIIESILSIRKTAEWTGLLWQNYVNFNGFCQCFSSTFSCLFPGSWLRSECNSTHRTSNTALHLQFKTLIDTSIDYMGEYEQTEEEYRFEGGKIPNYVLKIIWILLLGNISLFLLWKLDLLCSW